MINYFPEILIQILDIFHTTANNTETDLLTSNLDFPQTILLFSNMKELHLIIIPFILNTIIFQEIQILIKTFMS